MKAAVLREEETCELFIVHRCSHGSAITTIKEGLFVEQNNHKGIIIHCGYGPWGVSKWGIDTAEGIKKLIVDEIDVLIAPKGGLAVGEKHEVKL